MSPISRGCSTSAQGPEYTKSAWDYGIAERRVNVGHATINADKFLDTLQDYLTLQQVAKEFGLRMRGYRKQGNACVVETDEGAKEVRRLRHSLEEYRFACAATEFLRGQGFSRLPRATWAPSGFPIAKVSGANYTMREWVPGTQVGPG